MKERTIRFIAGALFVVGIYWAILSLPFLFLFLSALPLQNTLKGLGLSLFINGWIIFGFAVWVGWYLRMVKPQKIRKRKIFWLLSALQNIVFAALWHDELVFLLWSGLAGGISLLLFCIDSDHQSNQAEHSISRGCRLSP